jgi:hypothetical protein
VRPENRHNPAFKDDLNIKFFSEITFRKPFSRSKNFIWYWAFEQNPTLDILSKYSQRHNTQFIFWVGLSGFYIGTVLFYLNYKITVYE